MMPESLLVESNSNEEINKWVEYLHQHRRDNYLRVNPSFIGVGVTLDELEMAVNKYKHLIESPSWVRNFHGLLHFIRTNRQKFGKNLRIISNIEIERSKRSEFSAREHSEI